MRIVGGLDIHRRQITFDYLDACSGQSRRGRIAPADRMLLRRWLATNATERPPAFAVDASTWARCDPECSPGGVLLLAVAALGRATDRGQLVLLLDRPAELGP
jgi:hypothetical protein